MAAGMLSYVAALLTLAVTCVVSGQASIQALTPAAFLTLSASIFRVEAIRPNGALLIGTGVTVAPGVVVTSCHVTRDAARIYISGYGMRWDTDAEYADTGHDVCFLRAPTWPGKPVALDESESLRPGQQVVALGYTGGAALSFVVGRVRALHPLEDSQIIESDTAFTSGASGGGLFDVKGELVGLLTFRLRGADANYYSVPARWIQERVPADRQWTEVQPLHGAPAFWQSNDDALPYFMRGAALDVQGRWTELIALTDRWSLASPRSAEPLLVRGMALQKLYRPQAAVIAFNDALKLSPDDPAAWYGLALAYASTGNEAELRRAEAKLTTLDDALAAELAAKLRPGQHAPR